MPTLLPVVRVLGYVQGGSAMSHQETALMLVFMAILGLEALFLARGGFEMVKEAMQNIGAIIWEVISWPWRQWRAYKDRKRIEQEWQEYIELHREELIAVLMKTAHQEMFGEKYTTEQALDGVAAGAEMMRKAGYSTADIREDKEERTWQDQIMGRFTKIN